MDISVIIPTFNRKDTLKRAIQSVVMQSYTPYEIIVIDDGSDDGTKEWLKDNFPNVKYIYQKNSGVVMDVNDEDVDTDELLAAE